MSPLWPYPVNSMLSLDGSPGECVNMQDFSQPSTGGGSETVQSAPVWGVQGLEDAEHELVVSMCPGGQYVVVDAFMCVFLLCYSGCLIIIDILFPVLQNSMLHLHPSPQHPLFPRLTLVQSAWLRALRAQPPHLLRRTRQPSWRVVSQSRWRSSLLCWLVCSVFDDATSGRINVQPQRIQPWAMRTNTHPFPHDFRPPAASHRLQG
jgi:hypothetical protein